LYAAIYGVTYAYRMHYLINALCLWLALLHLSCSPRSLASWTADQKPAEPNNSSSAAAAATDKMDLKGKKRG
jgi:hypothetical protein